METELLTKHSWTNGLLIASFQLIVVVLVCYLRFIVELFRQREYKVGILFAILFLLCGGGMTVGVLAGLPVGWRYAREWKIRPWMLVWSVALAGIVLNISLGILFKEMTVERWREYFGWLPAF